MGRARDLANILSSSGSVALDSEVGLIPITPTSISTTGGSATSSISATGAVSFASASAINLNGCFSSTYESYKVIIKITASQDQVISTFARLRSGTTDTSTNYKSFIFSPLADNYTTGTSVTGTSTTGLIVGFRHSSTGNSVSSFDLHYPQLENQTHIQGNYNSTGTTTLGNAGLIIGMLNDTVQYSSISFFMATGVMTGNICVYGYRK